jgi:hypothetical protein
VLTSSLNCTNCATVRLYDVASVSHAVSLAVALNVQLSCT